MRDEVIPYSESFGKRYSHYYFRFLMFIDDEFIFEISSHLIHGAISMSGGTYEYTKGFWDDLWFI
ncbi:MAG: hypothetical protein R2850_03895 [Bacteroidia bacterium]